MRVVFFHRKPRPNVNFSVEKLFDDIRSALPSKVNWRISEARFYSNGFFKRLFIGVQAMFNQGDVNHVTGDINFVAIFLRKKRTVLTILDLGLMNNPNRVARKLLFWFWIVLPVRRSAMVTTISEATKRELLRLVKVRPSKIRVIYVPISPLFVADQRPFNKNRPRILQIGTKSNKNVSRLVEALRGIPCILEIVGEISEQLKGELLQSGINYSSSKNLSNKEVVECYRSCDILSFVSTYEGFGMPIVEANLVGRVVVTSNLLSMPEVAGDAAHLVDPFDIASIRAGILKVISDDLYREQLVSNGFKNAQRFNTDVIANQYLELYQNLFDASR